MTVYLVISQPRVPCKHVYTVYIWFWPTLFLKYQNKLGPASPVNKMLCRPCNLCPKKVGCARIDGRLQVTTVRGISTYSLGGGIHGVIRTLVLSVYTHKLTRISCSGYFWRWPRWHPAGVGLCVLFVCTWVCEGRVVVCRGYAAHSMAHIQSSWAWCNVGEIFTFAIYVLIVRLQEALCRWYCCAGRLHICQFTFSTCTNTRTHLWYILGCIGCCCVRRLHICLFTFPTSTKHAGTPTAHVYISH